MKKSQSSEYFNKLEKTLAIDDEGNATFAKDVQADGTIGGNSGLKFLHEYHNQSPDFTLKVYLEIPNDNAGGWSFFGELEYDGFSYLSYGIYDLYDGQISFFNALYYADVAKPYAVYYRSETGMIIECGELLASIDFNSTVQKKLYNHTLTLIADSKSYTLIYQSTVDLNVNSIADLRRIINIKSSTDNIILPVCLTDLSGTAALQITTSLCKIGAANVTAVSDIVTPK